MMSNRSQAKRIASELEGPVFEARSLAQKFGLQPYRVNFWIVDNDEMNQLIAYDGFQHRYPHWRWGMKYERQRKSNQYLGGKAFELVNNDNPANAFLQQSNSITDQKAVITHVQAHSDFFANNNWFGLFGDEIDAAAMLSRHATRIESIMEDPEIDRSEVEQWIDNILSIHDTIDQHAKFTQSIGIDDEELRDQEDLKSALDRLGLSDEVRYEVFDQEWVTAQESKEMPNRFPPEPESDVLAVLREYGKQFDDEAERAIDLTDWQREIIEILRREAYYFAPQRMTKILNEGWASYWESIMMGEAGFATGEEFIEYADHQSKILSAPGMNPYRLGKQLWEYIENMTNRKQIVSEVLRVDGITWRNFHDVVDPNHLRKLLEPRPEIATINSSTIDELREVDAHLIDGDAVDRAETGAIDVDRHPWKVLNYAGLAERHYSLVKPQNRGFLGRISPAELERIGRYIVDDSRYPDIETAVDNVDRTAGWDRMFEIRESHNDVTFIDEFLTQEFVDEQGYFTYEYAHSSEDFRVTSTDFEEVKKKLLLQFTNFGKPSIAVHDANYRNRNELLLGHRFNGIALDIKKARKTLERIFALWGRPTNLMTIVKELSEKDLEVARRRNREPTPTERGILLRYDGTSHSTEELDSNLMAEIEASDIDYDTKPDDWLL